MSFSANICRADRHPRLTLSRQTAMFPGAFLVRWTLARIKG
jgi:hypothetical protein